MQPIATTGVIRLPWAIHGFLCIGVYIVTLRQSCLDPNFLPPGELKKKASFRRQKSMSCLYFAQSGVVYALNVLPSTSDTGCGREWKQTGPTPWLPEKDISAHDQMLVG